MGLKLDKAVVEAIKKAIERIVAETENKWDDAAAVVVNFLIDQYLGGTFGATGPPAADVQPALDELAGTLNDDAA